MDKLSLDMKLAKLTALVTTKLKDHKENLEEKVKEILRELDLLFWIEECSYHKYDSVTSHSDLPKASFLQKKLFDFNRNLKSNPNFQDSQNKYKVAIICEQIYEIMKDSLAVHS